MKMQISLSSDFGANVLKMFNGLSDADKEWFRLGFPKEVRSWLVGDYNGKVHVKTTHLQESYSARDVPGSEILKPRDIDALIHGFWLVRKCHGPISVKALYRITAMPENFKGNKAVITREGQQKAITSWSTNKNVHVVEREASSTDHVLAYLNPNPKHILTNTKILDDLSIIMLAKKKQFGLDVSSQFARDYRGMTASEYAWKMLQQECRRFSGEEEYLIFLDDGETIQCSAERK